MYIEALSQWWSSMMFSHRSAKIPKEAREGDLTGVSKVPGRSAKDPGHLLASLNCASAQAEEDGSSGLAMQRHDFALDRQCRAGGLLYQQGSLLDPAYLACLCNTIDDLMLGSEWLSAPCLPEFSMMSSTTCCRLLNCYNYLPELHTGFRVSAARATFACNVLATQCMIFAACCRC